MIFLGGAHFTAQVFGWHLCACGRFFAGVIGRVLSCLPLGAADAFFTAVMVVGLIGPMIVAYVFARGLRALGLVVSAVGRRGRLRAFAGWR